MYFTLAYLIAALIGISIANPIKNLRPASNLAEKDDQSSKGNR
jgi:hypothetical protein